VIRAFVRGFCTHDRNHCAFMQRLPDRDDGANGNAFVFSPKKFNF